MIIRLELLCLIKRCVNTVTACKDEQRGMEVIHYYSQQTLQIPDSHPFIDTGVGLHRSKFPTCHNTRSCSQTTRPLHFSPATSVMIRVLLLYLITIQRRKVQILSRRMTALQCVCFLRSSTPDSAHEGFHN